MGDAYASHQKEFFAKKKDWTRERLDEVFNKLPKGAAVLDVGCGAGADVITALEKGFDSYGIDPSETMRNLALETITDSKRIGEGDYEHIPFSDGTFDLVFGRYSFHYLRELDAAYKELARVLKPGGVLVLIVSHPTYDDFKVLESGDKDTISVKLYDGKVTVTFPPHRLSDYFSATFFDLFDLQDIGESKSVDAENPHKLPETLYFKAVKR